MDNDRKNKKNAASVAPDIANDQLGENAGIDMGAEKRSSNKKQKKKK